MTVLIYCFRERETLDMLRGGVGARMHAQPTSVPGVYRDLPDTMPQYQVQQDQERERPLRSWNQPRRLLDFIDDFTQRFPPCVDDYRPC